MSRVPPEIKKRQDRGISRVFASESIDTTAAILHVGHNIASQQTVLWARILDRLAGKNHPKLVFIPRQTFTAKAFTNRCKPPQPLVKSIICI